MDENTDKNNIQQDQSPNQGSQDSGSVHDAIEQQDTQEVPINNPPSPVEESVDGLISMDELEPLPGDEGEKRIFPEDNLDVVPEDTAQIVLAAVNRLRIKLFFQQSSDVNDPMGISHIES